MSGITGAELGELEAKFKAADAVYYNEDALSRAIVQELEACLTMSTVGSLLASARSLSASAAEVEGLKARVAELEQAASQRSSLLRPAVTPPRVDITTDEGRETLVRGAALFRALREPPTRAKEPKE